MQQQSCERQEVPKELIKYRKNFPQYILSNPNYFGNLESAGKFDPIFKLQNSTYYENLGCLGLQP